MEGIFFFCLWVFLKELNYAKKKEFVIFFTQLSFFEEGGPTILNWKVKKKYWKIWWCWYRRESYFLGILWNMDVPQHPFIDFCSGDVIHVLNGPNCMSFWAIQQVEIMWFPVRQSHVRVYVILSPLLMKEKINVMETCILWKLF